MSLVNIPRYCEDPNYRYKMPKLQSRIEGRGNGIKTNISNMGDIARALKRPPTYTTKFFGCELGAMSKFEEAEEKALINGAHTERALTQILDKFIEMYVLCSECHLPEIEVLVRKGALCSRCNACGHKGTLDNTHKAASYMLKNPACLTEMSKHSGRTKKEVTKDASPEKEKDKDKEKDRKKKDKKERKKRVSEEGQELVNGTDAILQSVEMEKLTIESPEIQDVVDRLTASLGAGKFAKPADFAEELHMLQLSQDFDNVCRFYVALCAIFSDKFDVAVLEEKISMLKPLLEYAMPPKDILTAMAVFVVKLHPEQLEEYPYICRALYANDLAEGGDFCRFYAKNARFDGILADAFLRTKEKAEPFVSWLQEDDDDETEDTDD
ncbi:Eukaryotic translation initiation factor 5 [Babesia sp. Xinjiang]|uniref:Eukaryotic translation initiation factor 5 n=1 Tax=Babesia sp. Xinjiang TaxID=462227 RepID=UPI000A23796D|nr:Eukaryotic translation initiation factor 5 [Babesia sp. Xinjiang]ORM42244.1 Eukaryotic translation initiation factor 5 [Babesia sp. Xinjiang]